MPLYAPRSACYTALVFRRSSAVEQLTVNQLVVGSIPTAGAKISQLQQALKPRVNPRGLVHFWGDKHIVTSRECY